jgi:hypothetical protein
MGAEEGIVTVNLEFKGGGGANIWVAKEDERGPERDCDCPEVDELRKATSRSITSLVIVMKGPILTSSQEASLSGRNTRRVAKVMILGSDLTNTLIKTRTLKGYFEELRPQNSAA